MTVLHQGRVFADGPLDENTPAARTCATYISGGPEKRCCSSAENLHTGYGAGDVLQGVGVEVEAGEVVGVIGRNGVGKSTLMKCLMGLLPARAGSVTFDATGIVTREPADRRARHGIGYVPQGREIFPHMTVRDNLRMGRLINDAKVPLAFDEMFGHFPFLKERLAQRAGTLSGGQQEMLAIARALIGSSGPDPAG